MSKRSPNVLIFFTDQQRFDTTGVHGNPMGLTPNFDRMAVNGTHCYHAYSCQPVCLPARMVLQTGKYASRFETHSNSGLLPDDAHTIAHSFKQAGYSTGYIGKWHMCHELKVPRSNRSAYDFWLGANVVELETDAYDAFLYDEDGERVELPGYRADGYTDAVIRYVHEHKDEPFFLMASWLEPHFQNTRDDYPAPEGYEEAYAATCWTPPDLQALGGTSAQHLPGYYGMVKRLDECLGRIRDALRSLGLLDDTIILFTCDHGCHFKTRNGEYKRSCHDASIRIPMAFSGPGFDGGGRLQQMVSLVDVPPTLLDACDLPVPNDMQGRSIMPLIRRDPEVGQAWPEEVLVEYFNPPHISRAVRTHRWTYSVKRTASGQDMADGWAFEEECLFDNKADPWQVSNLISHGAYAGVKDVMRERLARRMQEAGENAPEITPTATGGRAGCRTPADSELYE